MFRIPQKQIVVNSNSQLRILKYDGSGTYINIGSPLLASTGFYIEGLARPLLFGELNVIPGAAVRIKSVAGSAAVVEIGTWTMNAITGNASSENFKIVFQRPSLSGVEYQNQPLEKHYQVSATNLAVNATATQVATAITASIQADYVKGGPFSATSSGAVVTITAREAGVNFTPYNTLGSRYVPGLISGAWVVTQAAALSINDYDALKTLKFADGLQVDFDRNAEYFPQFGQTYKGYEFITHEPTLNASELIPGMDKPSVTNGFKIWIANGLTLQTTMDLVVTNANAAT